MRFVVVHKVASYLMVATALLTVGLGATLGLPLLGLIVLGVGVSWWWEPPRIDLERFERAWNVATIGMLVWVVVDMVTTGAMLDAALDFVIFLTLNKLFNRRASRDYLQLYVLSFLQMTAATVLNAELSFGVLFLLYVVFTTWTLILFHLKREMEENYLLKYGGSLEGRPVRVQRVMNSRKLVGPRFLVVTSLLSVVVFLGAATLFVLFPRVGFGYFFKKRRAGISMTGFSDRVELGHFGRIKNDPTVVMRVEFDRPGDRARLAPYWRGIAFDHYDGHRWTKSSAVRWRPRRFDGRALLRMPDPDAGPEIAQSIYLEPMAARMLFGLSRLEAIGFDRGLLSKRRSVRIDEDDDVHYLQSDEIAFNYRAYSRRERIDPALLALPLADYRRKARQQASRYLQRPEALDPRIIALGAQIVGDARTVGEAVDRVERWLKANLSYTLDLKRDPRTEPLADFLFVQRKGHCEYFATAMAVLLRTQGIATRHVNGFLGGTWNDYGGFLAVSQGDAHSWIEVWLGESVWATRDPTPAGAPRPQADGWLGRLRQYTDALRMRWYKYVVEYDLRAQAGIFKRARALWRSVFGRGRGARGRSGRTAAWVLIGAMLLLFGGWLVWRRRPAGRHAAGRRPAAIARIYEALLAAYRRSGHLPRQVGTAREVLALLEGRDAPDLATARAVIERYERVRFGGAAIEAGELSQLRKQIKQIGRSAAA